MMIFYFDADKFFDEYYEENANKRLYMEKVR